MARIRIGSVLKKLEWPPTVGRPHQTADNLAWRVFDADLNFENVKKYYLHSEPIIDVRESFGDYPFSISTLGEFEATILGKMLSPVCPALCITGPMGSGKSTTIKYILGILETLENKVSSKKYKRPLIAYIDFNQHRQFHIHNGESIDDEFYNLLCNEMSARINFIKENTDEEEFINFWNSELNLYDKKESDSLAFRTFASKMKEKDLRRDGVKPYKRLIKNRKNILKKYGGAKEIKLDYLILLWKFITKNFFEKHGNGVIVFDNLDILHPEFQNILKDIVYKQARIDGPTFILLLRPETLFQTGLGTGVLDIENLIGQTPYSVIRDRCKRFIDNPQKYFVKTDGLTQDQFLKHVDFFNWVSKKSDGTTINPLEKVITEASGRDIRSGLILVHSLFRTNQALRNSPDKSLYDVSRLILAGGPNQMNWDVNHPIEHFYRVNDYASEAFLVKSRIVKYIANHPQNRRRIHEIFYATLRFGYDDELITLALKDLMRLNCQIIRSSGFDFIHNPEAMKQFSAHRVTLTEKGLNYSEKLLFNLEYLQTTMLDTWIEKDNIKIDSDGYYLSDKVKLIIMFLKELVNQDIIETDKFISAWGTKPYFKHFGKNLITYDLLVEFKSPINQICKSKSWRNSNRKVIFEKIYIELLNLILVVEEYNFKLLNVDRESIVTKEEERMYLT